MYGFSTSKQIPLDLTVYVMLIALNGCTLVYFSPPGGEVSCPHIVSLSAKPRSARIHYTTNGKKPTSRSSIYKEPLTVSNSQTIKAMAVDGSLHGTIVSEQYVCKPDMDRSAMAVLLVRSLNLPVPAQKYNYSDIHPGDAMYPAAQAISPYLNRGVLCPNCLLSRSFSGGRQLSRGEAAVVLVTVLVKNKRIPLLGAKAADNELRNVKDARGLSPVARRYIATAIKYDLLKLKQGNLLTQQNFQYSAMKASLGVVKFRMEMSR